MATYHDPEDTVYKLVRDQPFTRIQGKPTWTEVKKVCQDLSDLALEVEVSYDWAGEYGLLGVIMGAVKYHSETGLNMIDPTKPPNTHAWIAAASTAQNMCVLTAENDLLKHDWEKVTGFLTGAGKNLRDALDPKYYDQLSEPIFRYKWIHPRQYFAHLKQHWVFLDKNQITKLKENYFRGWQSGEHLTKLTLMLDKEQLQLNSDGVVISDADKNIHYMNQIWDCDIFLQETVTTWGQKRQVYA